MEGMKQKKKRLQCVKQNSIMTFAGSEGKAFDGNVAPDKATG